MIFLVLNFLRVQGIPIIVNIPSLRQHYLDQVSAPLLVELWV
ncbi:hypothetical protein C900_01021 [Fulvivirga imtechensis AK7]|uniref:Uncharacterized protein n=1 Tax=Fulvivirga imtechensis AK7 TaxID=1237149 RepID=L8JZM0_9BACT|nr:hypothetical protein C900_01021 [Fulvivirga imtechensis AK7]